MTKSCLLLIDIQYDFLPPDGSLAVANGTEVLPVVYRLLDAGKWDMVIASQDHHPPGHISFASRHSLPPFTNLTLPHRTIPNATFEQELWPDHCVQGTRGTEIEDGVMKRLDEWKAKGKGRVVQKGEDKEQDEYSAFQGNAKPTGGTLGSWLAEEGITELFVAGIATDFCVRFSVLEALRDLGPSVNVYVVKDAVRAVDPVKGEQVLLDLEAKGAKLVESNSADVLKWLDA